MEIELKEVEIERRNDRRENSENTAELKNDVAEIRQVLQAIRLHNNTSEYNVHGGLTTEGYRKEWPKLGNERYDP